MKRREFIKLSAISSASLSASALSAHQVFNEAETNAVGIDPIVPFNFFVNRKEKMLAQMIEMKQRFGLSRFLLTAPMDYVRLNGYPSLKIYQKIGETVLFVKNKLAPHDIEVGWWCAPSLRSGSGAPFQYITDLSGDVSNLSLCPLDEQFVKDFGNKVATVAEISRPFMIQFEDDYELSHQPPTVRFGCFCPKHLDEFAKRQQKHYSREELYKIFQKVDAESIKLRRQWAELSRDSLVHLAASIREHIDSVSPETRVSLCQSGVCDLDGDFTKAVTRAFAGTTRPAVRLYGTSYGSDNPQSLPGNVFHALYSKQHLPDDFECYHESDTYPHTRFFMSAAKIKSLMTATFSYGFDDSLFYATQYLDAPLEEEGYFKMFRSERKRFTALKRAVQDCEVTGVEIVHRPFAHIVNPYLGSGRPRLSTGAAWASIIGRYGIPYTTKDAKVKVLAGTMVEMMDDQEIKSLLKGGVLMDGEAAYSLYKKGWGKMIGADKVAVGREANFSFEGIREPEDYGIVKGSLMYNLIFAPAGTESGNFFTLQPDDEAEIITDFLNGEEEAVIPGMYRFQNELGGRVAVTAFKISGNRSSGILNYKKKEIIRQNIEWLGSEPLPVFVKDLPNVFCIFNRSRSGDFGIITLINLCSDTFESFSLNLSPEWDFSTIKQMDENGEWQKTQVKKVNQHVKLDVPLILMKPVIFRIAGK
jgi:hypothetical protein